MQCLKAASQNVIEVPSFFSVRYLCKCNSDGEQALTAGREKNKSLPGADEFLPALILVIKEVCVMISLWCSSAEVISRNPFRRIQVTCSPQFPFSKGIITHLAVIIRIIGIFVCCGVYSYLSPSKLVSEAGYILTHFVSAVGTCVALIHSLYESTSCSFWMLCRSTF